MNIERKGIEMRRLRGMNWRGRSYHRSLIGMCVSLILAATAIPAAVSAQDDAPAELQLPPLPTHWMAKQPVGRGAELWEGVELGKIGSGVEVGTQNGHDVFALLRSGPVLTRFQERKARASSTRR